MSWSELKLDDSESDSVLPTRGLLLRGFAAFVGVQIAIVVFVALFRALWSRSGRAPKPEPAHWTTYEQVELDARGDRGRLFAHGTELYAAMLEAIEQAEHTIYLETFIWKGDDIGRAFRAALERKAAEGVDVRVIYDRFANLVVPADFKRFDERIQVLVFRPTPTAAGWLAPRNLLRDHRKLLVVDDVVGFVGGYNIGGVYAADDWRDTHLLVRGSCVKELTNAFIDFWNAHRSADLDPLPDVVRRSWQPAIQLHRNDPFMRIFPIRGMYLEAIDRAERHIYITQAYFVPDRAFRAALAEAAGRGVDVQILLPWVSNHAVADWLARRHFDELLNAGVRLFACQHMIHAKTATIDGRWSTVGTANIDRLSLLGNYEVNLEIYSEPLAAQLDDMFGRDKQDSIEIDLERWRRRPLHRKAAERVLETLSPLV